MNRTVLLALAAMVTSPLAAQQPIDEGVRTAPTGTVEVSNTAGTVHVRTWDRSEVQVKGRLGRGAERVEVVPSGSDVTVRVVLPRNARNVQGTDLEVWVPERKAVAVRTVSADARVDGVRGPVTAHSVSGEVEVTGAPRSVSADSKSGSIRVDATTEEVRAQTVSGEVRVQGRVAQRVEVGTVSGGIVALAATPASRIKSVSGDVDVRGVQSRLTISTVSGDARVSAARLEDASMESVSGDLTLEGALATGGSVRMQSHSGDVMLSLPDGSDARFDVTTFSGDIDSALGPKVERARRAGPGEELRFTVGQGSGRVSLRTFSGDVKLRKR